MNRRELMQAAIGAAGCAALPDVQRKSQLRAMSIVLPSGLKDMARYYIDGIEVSCSVFWGIAFNEEPLTLPLVNYPA